MLPFVKKNTVLVTKLVSRFQISIGILGLGCSKLLFYLFDRQMCKGHEREPDGLKEKGETASCQVSAGLLFSHLL